MKLIVGLGNPTEQYAKTRHNIGFMALDYYLKDKNLTPTQKFKGIIYKGPDVMYLKPQTGGGSDALFFHRERRCSGHLR